MNIFAREALRTSIDDERSRSRMNEGVWSRTDAAAQSSGILESGMAHEVSGACAGTRTEKAPESSRLPNRFRSGRAYALFVRDDCAPLETEGAARPPLPLMARLLCLFIERCVDSEVAPIGDTRIAGPWALYWCFT